MFPFKNDKHATSTTAEKRADAAMAALHPIPLDQLPGDYRMLLVDLARLGYEVDAYTSGPDQQWQIWLPAAQDHNITKPDGLPVVWSGRISPADWCVYGEEIARALLVAHQIEHDKAEAAKLVESAETARALFDAIHKGVA